MKEILIGSLCLAGCSAILVASIGILRFPEFFTRTHAATKASAFGLAILLLAVCLAFPHANVILKAVISLVALFLTLPVASQALADVVRGKNKPDDSAS
jgi:multicomponent Na+:H+ antiporter subunit G